MRVTNNMISNNTKSNINSNKILVDMYNNQMTTQKKIAKASEDPVIAIRSLRLSTNLSHLDQYVDNNIPDADAWLDVTETALNNMKALLTDVRTQCVNGSNDTLSVDDRNTILRQLEALSDQIYSEGNADYAGRTVFTGYRTSSKLTMDTDQPDLTYQIEQEFSYLDMEEHRYYMGNVEVPSDANAECTQEVYVNAYQRLRLAYDSIESVESFSYTANGVETQLIADGTPAAGVTVYDTEKDWEAAGKTVGADEVIFLKDTGEFVFGDTISAQLISDDATFKVNYTKRGFESGEVRPEFYYNCTDISDPTKPIAYEKADQDINYTIANGTTLTINTQAENVFDTSIRRDIIELINVVETAISAQEKVKRIEDMMTEERFADPTMQANLQTYLDAAQKEADYAEDNMQKVFGQYISNCDEYLQNVNIAITNVGSTQVSLELTQTRVSNQQTTMEELKSKNEDRDISDIIIDYYAAYNAYQSSLTAASKVGERTLLDYL